MSGEYTVNLQTLEKVAQVLGKINEEVIYVGGAVVSLYATDPAAEEARPTTDIDVSVQIGTYSEMEALREKLAKRKIFPASTENVMYRYTYEDILIDFIPYEPTPLGPTNTWLKPGFQKAYPVEIDTITIKILPVSMFLATKWEAYNNRGDDPRFSHDFEDIIYVLDNNIELLDIIKESEIDVIQYLKKMSERILSHPSANEIIECHLNPYTADERSKLIIERLERIMNIDENS